MSIKFKTERPANNPDVVSIAELAQYTPIGYAETVQDADPLIREEWRFEISKDPRDGWMDYKKAQIVFVDGSKLTLTARVFRG